MNLEVLFTSLDFEWQQLPMELEVTLYKKKTGSVNKSCK